MWTLRAHIHFHYEKKKLRIEKIMKVFLIFKKIFLKIEKLMCDLKTHINWTHIIISPVFL